MNAPNTPTAEHSNGALPIPDGVAESESTEVLRLWLNNEGEVRMMIVAPTEDEVVDQGERARTWAHVFATVIATLADKTVPEDPLRWARSVAISIDETLGVER